MKAKGLLVAVFLILTASAVLGYSIFWFVMAGEIRKEITDIFDQAAENDIIIEGAFPTVSGFPGKHRITFSGTFHDGVTVNIPALEISGFLIPGRSLDVTLTEGLSISSDDGAWDSTIWSLDYLSLAGPVPDFLPDSMTVESLRTWRDHEGRITLTSFTAHKESLQVAGNGELSLDSSLQPTGYFNALITGHVAFLGFLEEKNLIEPKHALITSSVLNGLSARDEESGERFLKASLSIQNRKLLLGPIQILTLPELHWPYKHTPSMDFE